MIEEAMKEKEKPKEEEKKEEEKKEEQPAENQEEQPAEEQPAEEKPAEEVTQEKPKEEEKKEEEKPKEEKKEEKPKEEKKEEPKPAEEVKEEEKINPMQIEEQKFLDKFEKRRIQIKELIDFYSIYGIVKEINGDLQSNEVIKQFKEFLYPVIYTIIGKKYSGKTELSKVLNQLHGITLLDFEEFKKCPEIKNLKQTTEVIVSKFINKLRLMEDSRVLIENFPENKDQYNFFIRNCKPIEKIYYLNAENSSCLERLNNIPISASNHVDCCTLNKLLLDFEKKNDFIKFLKRQTIDLRPKDENGYFLPKKEKPIVKPKVVPEGEAEDKPKVPKEEPLDLTDKKLVLLEVDVNNHKILVIKKFTEMIQPFCAIIKTKEETKESKDNLVNILCNKYQFQILDINKIIENALSRKMVDSIPEDGASAELKTKLIRPLLFNENCNKFILENFPVNLSDILIFEKNLCSINKLIFINDSPILDWIQDENAIEIYFKNNNKLNILPSGELKEFQIMECLNMTKDINIVYGMPFTGKTTIAQHLKTKYNFELLDFNKLIKAVKKSKVPPDEPDTDPESIEITFDDDYTYIDSRYGICNTVTLDSNDVNAFVRYRDTDKSGSDNDRMDRQGWFLKELFNKMAGSGTANLISLYEAAGDHLCTDMDAEELKDLSSVTLGNIYKVPGNSVEGNFHDEYYIDSAGLRSILIDLLYEEI